MKASLHPITKSRIPWFNEKAQVDIEREVDVAYTVDSVQNDFMVPYVQRRYVFNLPQEREIPASDIVMMSQGMPFLSTRTQGNISQKLPTVKLNDPTIVVEDRIMNREKGKETVTIEDTPFPNKIQETRVREDVIMRKLSFKNELGKDAKITVKITESADIQIIDNTPQATTIDKPHYTWEITVAKDATTHIQSKYRIRIEKVRQIDKPVDTKTKQAALDMKG